LKGIKCPKTKYTAPYWSRACRLLVAAILYGPYPRNQKNS